MGYTGFRSHVWPGMDMVRLLNWDEHPNWDQKLITESTGTSIWQLGHNVSTHPLCQMSRMQFDPLQDIVPVTKQLHHLGTISWNICMYNHDQRPVLWLGMPNDGLEFRFCFNHPVNYGRYIYTMVFMVDMSTESFSPTGWSFKAFFNGNGLWDSGTDRDLGSIPHMDPKMNRSTKGFLGTPSIVGLNIIQLYSCSMLFYVFGV